MKSRLILILFFVSHFNLFAQDEKIEINIAIQQVKICLQGAEIIREGSATIPQGMSELVFSDLSPKTNIQSIQLQLGAGVQVLSVSSRINFIKESKENDEFKALRQTQKQHNRAMESLRNEVQSHQLALKVLETNITRLAGEQGLSIAKLKEATDFYQSRSLAAKEKITDLNLSIVELREKANKVNAQIAEMNGTRKSVSEVYAVIKTETAKTVAAKLRYVVQDAGWSPIYDLNAGKLNEPIELKYRALAYNNTGVDWKKVKVSLSTSDPMQSSSAPVMQPWQINQNVQQSMRKYKGRANLQNIAQNQVMNIDGRQRAKMPSNQIAAANIRFEEIEISMLDMDFDIKERYDIPANAKPYSIDIATHNLNASYRHFTVPKIDKDAFLLAEITGWEKLNLIPGPVNVYHGESYVGLSNLDTESLKDTLDLSLGRDPKIAIKRIKAADVTKKQFLGNNKIWEIGYEIQVKNNHAQAIEIEVQDQIPVSNLKEIEVTLLDKGNANLFRNTGKLQWKFKLQAGETKKLRFSFKVKYPKDREIKMEKTKRVMTPRYF